ncbi:MAG: hypothetical protein N3J91_04120 [Verrucomicrobiae bacterium]|nr:hypothetical protein [Verrucomicrobiae bacterium]
MMIHIAALLMAGVMMACGQTTQEPSIVASLRGLVIVPDPQMINRLGVSNVTGLQIRGPAFLDNNEFRSLITPYLNKELSETSLRELQVKVIKYCASKGYRVVDVYYPDDQRIVNGTVQMAVVLGKVGKVTVKNEGKKWYSDQFILRRLGLREGENLSYPQLVERLERLSQQPDFRDVTLKLSAASDFLEVTNKLTQGNLGYADVQVEVRDRFPLRPYLGYDNYGTKALGKDRLNAGITWAYPFLLDHSLDYRYTTDVELDLFESHVLTYLVSLPWGHRLSLLGCYASFEPDWAALGSPAIYSKGSYYQLSARYNASMPKLGNYRHELSVGFDFRRLDSSLLFSSAPLPSTPIGVGQFAFGYRGVLPDSLGQTTLGVEAWYSPGGLVHRNTDGDYDAARGGSSADYVYGQLEAERVFKLPAGFSLAAHGVYQYTPQRLTYSEMFGVGGYATVRGYDERYAIGDTGYFIRTELRSPVFRRSSPLGKNRVDGLQVYAFFDHGETSINKPQVTDQDPHVTMQSVGGGLRMNLHRNFELRFEAGYQLKIDDEIRRRVEISDQDYGFHLTARLLF